MTGVLTDSSIAFHVARVAQQEGAAVGAEPHRAAEPRGADREAAAGTARRCWSST